MPGRLKVTVQPGKNQAGSICNRLSHFTKNPKRNCMKFMSKRMVIGQLAIVVCFGLLIGMWALPAGSEARMKELLASGEHTGALSASDFLNPLAPDKEQTITNIDIIDKLKYQHYQRTSIDDRLSSKVFDQFISGLDSSRLYFLASDIVEFEKFRYQLDDALEAGNLGPAFTIFNRYQERLVQRLVYLINMIDAGLDRLNLEADEVIAVERKTADWPQTVTELDDLWRKRLKNNVINLKLAGKNPDDIATLLGKRYRSQLNRVLQQTSEDVFRDYMNALARAYDPHTQYYSPRGSENFNIRMRLSLEGIGAVLQGENEFTRVLRLVPGGPADLGNQLKPGDRIVGVGQGLDGEIVDIIGWRLDDAVELIRGPKETVVRLEIIPADAEDESQRRVIHITRNTVRLEEQAAQKSVLEISHEEQTFRLGVIRVPTFYIDFKAYQEGDPNYRSTTRDVRRLIDELKAEHIDGIIVDLRENGGGALQEANALTGLFIRTGPTVQVRSTSGQITAINDLDPEIAYDGPLVVLVNRLSASASEIFAGAVQDYQRGIVIGSPTFGKGTVQSMVELKHGRLILTLAKFYRISGSGNQQNGVVPDILFPAVYDADEIGESALPGALPWDHIQPARYQPTADFSNLMDQLRHRHQLRAQNEPEFEYLQKSLKRQIEIRSRPQLSLKESVRRKERQESERWRLELENERRVSKGLKPVKSLDNIEQEESDGETPPDHEDPFMIECGHILADLIALSDSPLARFKATAK